ncbi:MAG: hypothetical protein WCW53_06380 [Syntrophales bacterium]|jgi:hypothetical protein
MSGLVSEFIILLVIALIIVAICILPGSGKKSSKEINDSEMDVDEPELTSGNSKDKKKDTHTKRGKRITEKMNN